MTTPAAEARLAEILRVLRARIAPELRGPFLDADVLRAALKRELVALLREEELRSYGDLDVLIEECLSALFSRGGPVS